MYQILSVAAFAAQKGWKEWQYYNASFFLMAVPIIFLYGICIGSFLNVVIIRLPRGESLIKRSSHCMTCGAKIRLIDLIPVFSWLFLHGKCHSCGEKISARYPIVEALNGFLYLACFAAFGMRAYTFIMCIFASLLVCIAFIDWDTMDMYVPMLLLIAALAIPSHFAEYLTLKDRLIGMVIISVPFFLIGEISGAVIKKKTGEKIRGVELGDTILMACAGVLLGWKPMIPAAFIGIILGAVCGVILKRVNGESKMAFGPFLCIGLLLGAMFGEEITRWYIESFLQEPDVYMLLTSVIR